MKKHIALLFAVGAALLAQSEPSTAAKPRIAAAPTTWKAFDGTEMTAEFVEIKDGRVILRSEERGMLSPLLSALAPESQAQARSLAEAAEKIKLAEAAKTEAARLKTLTPEKRASVIDPRNYFTTKDTVFGPVVTKEYDAYIIEPQSRLLIFIKENGAYKSEPIRIVPDFFYNDLSRATNRHTRRDAKNDVEAPAFNLKEGTYGVKRLHADEVVSEVVYTCKPGVITVGYQVVDPSGIKYETGHRVVVNFSKTYLSREAPDGTMSLLFSPRLSPTGGSRADLLALTDNWKIEFRHRPASGESDRLQNSWFAYNKSAVRFPNRAESATISGGVFGPRTVTICTTGGGGEIMPWIYSATPPMDGFSLQFRKESGKAPPYTPAGMLKIEIK